MASVATELPPIPIQGNPKRDGVGGGGGGGGVGVEVVSLPPVVPGKVSDQELPKLRDGAPVETHKPEVPPVAQTRPYTIKSFRAKLRKFERAIRTLTLKDEGLSLEERKQYLTETLGLENFCKSIRAVFGPDIRRRDLNSLFCRLLTNPDAEIDWSEAFGLLYRESGGETKIENDIGEESKNIFCTYKREKLKDSAACASRRRDYIQMVNHVRAAVIGNQVTDLFLTASLKGHLCVFNGKHQLLSKITMSQESGSWVTGIDYLPNLRRIVATTERSVVVWDAKPVGRKQHILLIKPLEHTPRSLCRTPPIPLTPAASVSEEESFLIGDDHGGITMIHVGIKDLQNQTDILDKSSAGGVSMATLLVQSLQRPVHRRQVHTDWVLKIKYYPKLRSFASCSASTTQSFVLDDPHRIVDNTDIKGVSIPKGCNTFAYCESANVLATGGADKIIRLWHPHIFSRPSGKLMGHMFTIIDLTFNEKEGHLISLSTSRVFRVWDLQTLTSLQVFNDAKMGPSSQAVTCMLFDNRNDQLLTGAATLDAWPLMKTVQDSLENPQSHERPIVQVLCVPKLNLVITVCTGSVLKAWELDSGTFIYAVPNPHGLQAEVTAMAIHPGGYRLATGALDGSISVWDSSSGQPIRTLAPIRPGLTRMDPRFLSNSAAGEIFEEQSIVGLAFCGALEPETKVKDEDEEKTVAAPGAKKEKDKTKDKGAAVKGSPPKNNQNKEKVKPPDKTKAKEKGAKDGGKGGVKDGANGMGGAKGTEAKPEENKAWTGNHWIALGWNDTIRIIKDMDGASTLEILCSIHNVYKTNLPFLITPTSRHSTAPGVPRVTRAITRDAPTTRKTNRKTLREILTPAKNAISFLGMGLTGNMARSQGPTYDFGEEHLPTGNLSLTLSIKEPSEAVVMSIEPHDNFIATGYNTGVIVVSQIASVEKQTVKTVMCHNAQQRVKVTSLEWIRWDKSYSQLLFPEEDESDSDGEDDLPQITWKVGVNNMASGGMATASSAHGDFTAKNAFRGPFGFWHSLGAMPQWLVYEFKEPKLVCMLTLKSRLDNKMGYVPLDGPTVYNFQGSNDGKDSKSWEDLVVVTSSAPWSENEMRTHHVHKPRFYKFYRLFIKASPGRAPKNGIIFKYAIVRDLRMYTIEDPLEMESFIKEHIEGQEAPSREGTPEPPPSPVLDEDVPLLCAGYKDSRIRFWSMKAKLILEIPMSVPPLPPEGSITALEHIKDEDLLMVADSRGYISVWSVLEMFERFTPSEVPLRPLVPSVCWRGHLAPIVKLRYVASSMTVISSSVDGSVRVWFRKTGHFLGYFGQYSPFFRPKTPQLMKIMTADVPPVLPSDIQEPPWISGKVDKTSEKKKRKKSLTAPLVLDEQKWEELSELQSDFAMDSARSEVTDDTEISQMTGTSIQSTSSSKYFQALVKPQVSLQSLKRLPSHVSPKDKTAIFRALPVYRILDPESQITSLQGKKLNKSTMNYSDEDDLFYSLFGGGQAKSNSKF